MDINYKDRAAFDRHARGLEPFEPGSAALRKSHVAAVEVVEAAAGSGPSRSIRFCISTDGVDRDNDTVAVKGWGLDRFKSNPVVLWAHDYSALPVGKATDVGVQGGRLMATAEFADHPFADTVYRMLKGGFLNATSVGFVPKTYKVNDERHGLDFQEQELLEFSVVPVPSNPEALIEARAAGIDVAPLKAWAEATLKGLTTASRAKAVAEASFDAQDDDALLLRAIGLLKSEADPVRWNRSLSKAFDVDGEPLDASSLEYTWVSRFLGVPVKDLFETTKLIASARMGTYLTALDDQLSAHKTETVRNLSYGGKEQPPVYESIQLNSKSSRSFLVEGLRFLSGGGAKMVAKVQPTWCGLALTLYAARAAAEYVGTFLDETAAKAKAYKFLKGEAFALSGEFLTRGEASWDDLFLTRENIEPLRRATSLLNEQGAAMDPRGIILMGPPGTGKTLAARAMMSEAEDATFIWCSARDFGRMGSFGGVTMAYELAAENAPSIVLLEDVDSAIYDVGDLIKTELDGLKTRKGIVTVLTTNFPELLPEALIDRPGRFHDVLNLGLPDESVRRRMLAAWAPDASAATLDAIARDTAGLSGAHVRDLVRFAGTVRSQDGVSLDDALVTALEKVKAQRELIDATRADRRGRYRAVKAVRVKDATRRSCDRCGCDAEVAAGVCEKCAVELNGHGYAATLARVAQFDKGAAFVAKALDVTTRTTTVGDVSVTETVVAKRGRVLSASNEGRIRRASEILGEVLAQLEAAPVEGDGTKPGDDDAVIEIDGKAGGTCCSCGNMVRAGACNGCDHKMCDEHVGAKGLCPHCAEATDGLGKGFELEVADDDVLVLADDDTVTPDRVRAMLREAAVAALGGIDIGAAVRTQVQTVIDRARGRVD